LYAIFLAIVFFTLYRILFPSISLVFSFSNINSPKNTLNLTTATLKSDTLTKGSVAANNVLSFDAHPYGNFSHVVIELTINKNSKITKDASLTIHKSYEAFFYPTGDSVGFRDGTLLAVKDTYYMVSDGVLRKFLNASIAMQLGYSKDSFMQVSQDDLKYNKAGSDIADATAYPDDTLFSVGDTYYQLKDQQLAPFVSTNAFLSQFDANQAITKNADFLNQYKLSEHLSDSQMEHWPL